MATQLRTTCTRDCPDACGIVATVDGGKVTQLAGDPEHPVTRGFLCFRTSRFPELAAAGQRIGQPLVRRDGRLTPATWSEALGLIAERITQVRSESGPASIFHYRSGGSLGILKHLTDLFFDQFGPCTGKVGDICSGAGEAAQVHDLGTSDSNDLFDLRHSRHIVLWGKNPAVSNVHLVPVLREAKARGAELTLIDPIHHKSTSLADHLLTLAPGRDFELVMAVARLLFDRAQVDPNAPTFCDGLPAFRATVERRTAAAWAAAAEVPFGAAVALADRFAAG
ncbi:MAG: molybdopterin-dependent oxidoreductase, partial [Planctomycetota bacterium]